jgi:hypothetical protein
MLDLFKLSWWALSTEVGLKPISLSSLKLFSHENGALSSCSVNYYYTNASSMIGFLYWSWILKFSPLPLIGEIGELPLIENSFWVPISFMFVTKGEGLILVGEFSIDYSFGVGSPEARFPLEASALRKSFSRRIPIYSLLIFNLVTLWLGSYIFRLSFCM